MSGKVIRPPMWQRKEADEDTGDRVIFLATSIQDLFMDHIDPPITQLAAILLAQRALLHRLTHHVGAATAKEAMRQAREMADQYNVILRTDTSEE